MKYNQTLKRIFTTRVFMLISIVVMNLLTLTNVNATTTTVNSVAALQSAINNSTSGDVLILANGHYLNNSLSINKSNITVKAATPGGVFLDGTNAITISGSNVTFSGFQFTSGDIGTGTVIEVTGSYNVITQLNFSNYYASKYIRIKDGSQYNEISYCNLEKKPAAAAIGCTIQISTSPTVIGYHKIRYCSFQNYFGGGGDNGNEPIRIGLGSERANSSRTIVEHCYFNNTGRGDSESVSIKCQENTIRFCTFTNQQDAMLVFRNGDNNVAYGNFFINAGGIRVKEANNIHCYNNYFENCGNGSATAPVIFLYDNSSVISHLNNLNIVNNTFVGGSPIQLGTYSTPNNGGVSITTFTNNTFANNIFKYSAGSIFSGSTSGISWAGNMYQGTLGIANPTTGMENTNTLLTLNADGFYGLPSNSPAINASISTSSILDIANIDDDPSLIYDISGQARVGIKDVGADEYSTETTTNHPLALSEVGPSYLFTEEPIASSPQTICGAATVASLLATGTLIKWYDAASGGSALDPSTALTNGTTYYVSQTLNSCESARKAVLVTIQTTTAPTASSNQSLVGPATVASLVATGTALKWYSLSTGGSALDPSTALTNGTTYNVSQTLNSCESARTAVVVTIQIATQTITFTLQLKYTNSPDFDPAAVSSNGSAITYTSSNPAVATITNDNKIHIVARGTSDITASSSGAASVTQQLIVQCSCVQN
jgi:hypothetical protein